MKIEEPLNVTFDETHPPSKTPPLVDDDLDEEEAIKVTEKKNLEKDIEVETLETNEEVNIKESRKHPLENIIGNLNQRTLRSVRLDGIVAREEVVTSLLLPRPSINHLYLISMMMMMEMKKGPRVQALPLPFVMSIP
ncbi:hypothetical protein Tco_0692941 [Tanacetum coccineum]